MNKLLESILSGRSDANISFRELCHLLRNLGFDEYEEATISSGNPESKNDPILSRMVIRPRPIRYSKSER